MSRPNVLLVGSAVVYFAAAVVCIFAGDEVLVRSAAAGTPLERILIQALGAALFGFAMLNWMNRFATIGGIYGRPLIVANFAHAFTAAMVVLQVSRRTSLTMPARAALAAYGTIAIAFGVALVTSPASRDASRRSS
jgi:hypothetical protein